MSYRESPAPLRSDDRDGQRVSFVELFFDLVYVFAITQLSHLLLEHPTPRGVLQALILLLAVWSAWAYTTWVTTWLDPERPSVRLMLLAGMLLSLVMSATMPQAFGSRGWYFAGAYVLFQVGRTVFTLVAVRNEPTHRANFQRILAWILGAGVLWLVGAAVTGTAREVLWAIAVVVIFAAPWFGFHTPGLGRSTTSDWELGGGHLAERFQLLVIIVLGESILMTGATLAKMEFTGARITAFAVAFVGSAALWWIYFDRAAQAGNEVIESADDSGRLARSAYTYSHLPMVAGIIAAAVGDELIIAHPGGHTGLGVVLTVLGGPALFLIGHAFYKRSMWGRVSLPRVVGVLALAALAPAAVVLPPLGLAIAATLVVLAVAGWDAVIARRTA